MILVNIRLYKHFIVAYKENSMRLRERSKQHPLILLSHMYCVK